MGRWAVLGVLLAVVLGACGLDTQLAAGTAANDCASEIRGVQDPTAEFVRQLRESNEAAGTEERLTPSELDALTSGLLGEGDDRQSRRLLWTACVAGKGGDCEVPAGPCRFEDDVGYASVENPFNPEPPTRP